MLSGYYRNGCPDVAEIRMEEFRRVGVIVTPYPTGYYSLRRDYWTVLSWVPSASALDLTSLALKEYLGLAAVLLR